MEGKRFSFVALGVSFRWSTRLAHEGHLKWDILEGSCQDWLATEKRWLVQALHEVTGKMPSAQARGHGRVMHRVVRNARRRGQLYVALKENHPLKFLCCPKYPERRKRDWHPHGFSTSKPTRISILRFLSPAISSTSYKHPFRTTPLASGKCLSLMRSETKTGSSASRTLQ